MTIFYLLYFLISFVITFFSIPKLLSFCKRKQIVDYPDSRKQHKKPVVRLGGISIFNGFILSVLILFILNPFYQVITFDSVLLNYIFFGTLFFSLGIYEDLIGLSPKKRLFFQFLFAGLFCINGTCIEQIDLEILNNKVFFFELQSYFRIIFTCFWIVGITNAINWFDGLDGLVAGFSIINFLTLAILSFSNNQIDLASIIIIILGACMAFFKYNHFPSKIIMGDGGSYFIGFSISVLLIQTFTKEFDGQIIQQNIFLPLFLISLPVLDMARVILLRMLESKSPFYPDRKHLHHKLIDFGFNHRDAVLFINFLAMIQSIVCLAI